MQLQAEDLFDYKKPYLTNLVIMMLTWSALGFSYTLVAFELKYLDGDIFLNSYTVGLAETVARLLAGVILLRYGIKPLFAGAFSISVVGSITLVYMGGAGGSLATSFNIMMTKFGVGMGWVAAFLSAIEIFPSELTGLVFGICNVCNKLVSLTAPMVAEMEPPTPLAMVAIVCTAATLLSQKFNLNANKHQNNPSKSD